MEYEGIPLLRDPYALDISLKGNVRILRGKVRSIISRVKYGEKSAPQGIAASPVIIENDPPVINYAKDTMGAPFTRRALVAYITRPFHEEIVKSNQSNFAQAVEIARALNRLGYVVDVIDYRDTDFVPAASYDLLFGINEGFGRMRQCMDATAVKVYYGTGAYWEFELAAERQRMEELRNRRAVSIDLPVRLGPNDYIQTADAIVVIGNDFTLSTHPFTKARRFAIDNSVVDWLPAPSLEHKDFVNARNHFLWLGSYGLLHKGLDLVLEAFAILPHLHLWVGGPLLQDNDRSLIKAYRRELFHTANIHAVGWVDMRSNIYNLLTAKCAALVFPSCAEGMSGGVLNCMFNGLIPLVSRQAGIDTDDFGFQLRELSAEAIRERVIEISTLSPDACRAMALAAHRKAASRYSLDAFRVNIEEILRTIVHR